MQSQEKVADRAGSLVTERVRGLVESAHGRAERVRRAAADEAHRLDSQRMQAASRIASEIEDLEGALGRLCRQMQSEHAVEGSVEEGRLIEAAQEGKDDVPADEREPSATASVPARAEAAGELPPWGQLPTEAEETAEAAPDAAEPQGSQPSEGDDDAQRSRFSILRRPPRPGEPSEPGAETEEPNPEPEQEAQTHECAVCGRGFTGDVAELRSLGWVVSASGEVTCADCLGAGWLRPND